MMTRSVSMPSKTLKSKRYEGREGIKLNKKERGKKGK